MTGRPEDTPEQRHDRLRRAWTALCDRLEAPAAVADRAYEDLVTRYGEPHRFYHTLEHIDHCLRELARAADLVCNREAVELALWYHDSIYDVRATDSEERSAALAESEGRALRIPDPLLQQAKQMILLTRHTHEAGPGTDNDARLLVDIDLAILGQPDDVFTRYDLGIRREYAWVADEAYRAGRAKALWAFLDRASIYGTDVFKGEYEKRARTNLARALRRLGEGERRP